jgi:hypothetical protein
LLGAPEKEMLCEISLINKLLGRFSNHPDLDSIRFAVIHEFDHTVFLLTAVAMMFDMGNGVGSLQGQHGPGGLPDFFVQIDLQTRLHFEVKAPAFLMKWSGLMNEQTMKAKAREIIEKAAKKTRAQIRRGHPGIMVLGSRVLGDAFHFSLLQARQEVLKRNGAGDLKHFAGITVLSYRSHLQLLPQRQLNIGAEFKTDFVPNTFFDGPTISERERRDYVDGDRRRFVL